MNRVFFFLTKNENSHYLAFDYMMYL